MLATRKFGLLVLALAALAGVSVTALGTGAFDRLRNTVFLGDGLSSTKSLIFDGGNGATNSTIYGIGSRVGVNIAAPNANLGVAAYSGSDVNTISSYAGTTTGIQRWHFYPSNGSTPNFEIDADHSGSANVKIQSDLTTIMEIDRGGNVGVGVFPPARKLDVGGTFGATGAATLGSTLGVTGTTTLAGFSGGPATLSSGGSLSGTYSGSPTLSGNVNFSGTPVFVAPTFNGQPSFNAGASFGSSTIQGNINFQNTPHFSGGVVDFAGGISTASQGTVKFKVFSGSSTSNAGGVVALSTGGNLLSVSGYCNDSGHILFPNSGICGAGDLAVVNLDHASGNFQIYNCGSGAKTYYAVAVYQ